MQPTLFEALTPPERNGFRLERLEVYNWGTFHQNVWRIEPNGDNALLTGDIGSGKSTLVDAITTLLVPQQRIVYNKAAGAESRERTLASYIRGEYKTEKDSFTQAARAVPLRERNSYTVLLAYFHNSGFEQGLTLAQVLWLKDQNRQVERFYVTATEPLTIKEHFSGFGTDILDLKRRLRKKAHTEVHETFREYATQFKRVFGIANDQALDLFYQTISLKSVGNLTEFVRTHMLEAGDVRTRIDELRRNFDNLNQAHEAVLKSKKQIELLQPLVEDGKKYEELTATKGALRAAREAIDPYFARMRAGLLDDRIAELEQHIARLASRLATLDEEIRHLRQQKSELQESIHASGGNRLERLEADIAALHVRRREIQARLEQYDRLLARLGLEPAADGDDFLRNADASRDILARLETDLATLAQQVLDRSIEIRGLQAEEASLQSELKSLRGRRNNIPLRNIEIRRELAAAINAREGDLPFAGELLAVDERESAWEGAIERVLHGFGLSILVAEEHYQKISTYVDRTHLKGRVVYFRVREETETAPAVEDERSLARKIRINPETRFYGWLERQLAERFNYVCCEHMEDFRRLPVAITKSGQIKTRGQRHEKDDRRAISDRAHFILGWENAAKIRSLEARLGELTKRGQRVVDELAILQSDKTRREDERDAARDLLKYGTFTELDWQVLARRVHELEEEKSAIESSSDVLKSLRSRHGEVESRLDRSEKDRLDAREKQVRDETMLRERREDRARAQAVLDELAEGDRTPLFARLDELRTECLADRTIDLRNLDKVKTDFRDAVQGKVDAIDKRVGRLRERVTGLMKDYKHQYPAETTDIDASLETVAEYAAILGRLRSEDLPRHEERFKQLLNEGTINSIALFQNQLEKERRDIDTKIATINRSLRAVEYNQGSYIELVMDRSQDADVRDFQQQLRACMTHGMDDESTYNEGKFLQVKTIIERFNGREGFAEWDAKWTDKVTDVRNWFRFSASEKWMEDDSEKEFYSDSSGKSGGQKEKLAYTVLASALAYQFGLEWNANRSRTFRFVVIDEAFGRGSDESARYGLELFRKLNLQLLIVTPLQKIHVIEDYVRSVHFVHNEEGRRSMVRNLTIEEYRLGKDTGESHAALHDSVGT